MAGRYTYSPKPKPGKDYIEGFGELLEALGNAVNTMTTIETMNEDYHMALMVGEGDNPEYTLPEDLDSHFYAVLEEAYQAMERVEDGFMHTMAIMSGLYKEMATDAMSQGAPPEIILLSARIILNTFSILIARYVQDHGIDPYRK